MPVRAVFFDAGDTLVHKWVLKAERFLWLCRQAQTPVPDDPILQREGARAQERYFQNRQQHEDRDSRDWFIRMNRLGLEGMGLSGPDLDALAATILDISKTLPQRSGVLDPEAIPLLKSLRASGYRLAIISNWDGTLVDILRPSGLSGYFDAVLDSDVVGSRKPEARMFEIACAACGVRPEEAVHVGDSPGADVLGALKAGITPVLLDPLDLFSEGYPGLPGRYERIQRLSELPELLAFKQRQG